MKIQKRHILMGSLVLALGAAVYLNWQFTGNSDMLSVDASKKLGEAQYVNGDITDETQEAGIFDSIFGGDDEKKETDASEETTGEDEAAVKTELTAEQISYFSSARTDREQNQSKVLEEAKEILSLSENSEEAKEEASESVSQLEKLILAQSNIENLLKAKGFADVVCFISDEGCNVVVASQNMNDNSSLVVKDAVMSQLDLGSEQIKIIQI